MDQKGQDDVKDNTTSRITLRQGQHASNERNTEETKMDAWKIAAQRRKQEQEGICGKGKRASTLREKEMEHARRKQ